VDVVRRIFAEIVTSVAHCHAHGVCHLDIKPDVRKFGAPVCRPCVPGIVLIVVVWQNVMFVDGRTVLTDFGNGQVFDASLPPNLAVTRFANEPRCALCVFDQSSGSKSPSVSRPRPYAPPELYRGGSGTYSLPLTDMWSLGALLHYLMTGQPVNRRDDGTTTLSPALGVSLVVISSSPCRSPCR
jgi:serine/threonine protein kinase